MILGSRVAKSPNICRVAVFIETLPPVETMLNAGSYFNLAEVGSTATDIYTTSGSVKFSETSQKTRAGVAFSQKLVFKLPTSDELRAQRISQFHKIKLLEITLTNGAKFLFGRNDINQNTAPDCKTQSDEKLTTVEFSQNSIMALPFLIQSNFLYQDAIQFIFQDGNKFIL